MKRTTHLRNILILIAAVGIVSTAACFAATSTSPFSNVAYTSYTKNSAFSNHLVISGVDVSVFQSRTGDDYTSNINWKTLKKAKVDYAIIRIGGTYSGYPSTAKLGSMYGDDTFSDHYTKARNNGLLVGAYYLSQALSAAEGKKEADRACDALEAKGVTSDDLEMPVYMDYEFISDSRMNSSSLTKKKATAAAVAFCKEIQARGYQPGIYASTSFYDKYIDASQLPSGTRLWIAQYYYMCEYSKASYDMWQYSSAGQMSNMFIDNPSNAKKIDCDFWYLAKSHDATDSSSIQKCTIKCASAVPFVSKGTLHKPTVTVKNSAGTTLKEGTHYTLSYIRNATKGTAYVYIRGIGKYDDYKVVSFKIVDEVENKNDLSAVKSYMTTDYTVSSNNKYMTGIATGTSVSQFLENITWSDSAYSAKVVSSSYKEVTSGNVKTGEWLYVYKNGVVVGAARLIVTKPDAPTISKLTATCKGFKVTWKKSGSTLVSGYQIRYSTDSSMSSPVTVKVSSSTATSNTISKLTAKKKYYVQVRAYVYTTTYHSSWSTAKTVTTK